METVPTQKDFNYRNKIGTFKLSLIETRREIVMMTEVDVFLKSNQRNIVVRKPHLYIFFVNDELINQIVGLVVQFIVNVQISLAKTHKVGMTESLLMSNVITLKFTLSHPNFLNPQCAAVSTKRSLISEPPQWKSTRPEVALIQPIAKIFLFSKNIYNLLRMQTYQPRGGIRRLQHPSLPR